MSLRDLAVVLGDWSLTWTQRPARSQGWRGVYAECADEVTGMQRLVLTTANTP